MKIDQQLKKANEIRRFKASCIRVNQWTYPWAGAKYNNKSEGEE